MLILFNHFVLWCKLEGHKVQEMLLSDISVYKLVVTGLVLVVMTNTTLIEATVSAAIH